MTSARPMPDAQLNPVEQQDKDQGQVVAVTDPVADMSWPSLLAAGERTGRRPWAQSCSSTGNNSECSTS